MSPNPPQLNNISVITFAPCWKQRCFPSLAFKCQANTVASILHCKCFELASSLSPSWSCCIKETQVFGHISFLMSLMLCDKINGCSVASVW